MMDGLAFTAAEAEEHAAGLAECAASFGQRRSPALLWTRDEAETILLGMPQLCLNGLSETWLLKELGHRHWMMLARLAGQKAPNFVDERGAPVYAAFCALSIRDGDFRIARENDFLVVSSRMRRLSRTRMMSRHELVLAGRKIGAVDMISTFVRRTLDGNHGVARFEPPGLPPAAPASEEDGLAACAAQLRSGRMRTHLGFAVDDRAAIASAGFDPCPSQDFNGAGFLYFSSFIAFVDRAEWSFFGDKVARATVARRDIFFFANLDPGEGLAVELTEQREEPIFFAHSCSIVRAQDRAVMARVFTVKSI